MLLYIILFQTVLLILLSFLFFYQRITFANKLEQSLNVKKTTEKTVDKTSNFFGFDQRKDFRVSVNEKGCLVEFLEFENKNLNKLKNKTFNGYIENISASGIKLSCGYDLPVKESIIIETKFSFKDEEFCLKGELKRKEEHNHKNLFIYGVHFIEISSEEQRRLSVALNEMIIEQRK